MRGNIGDKYNSQMGPQMGGQTRGPMGPPAVPSTRYGSELSYGPPNFPADFNGMIGRSPPRFPSRQADKGYDTRSNNPSDGSWSSMGMPVSVPPGFPPPLSLNPYIDTGKTAYLRGNRRATRLTPVSGKPKLSFGDSVWNEEIFRIFTMTIGFVQLNCTVVDESANQALAECAPRLWAYICSVTYPDNKQNAANHALYLLRQSQYRTYFLTRLLVQYIVQQMWDTKAWEGLNEDVTQTLTFIKRQLARTHGPGKSSPLIPLLVPLVVSDQGLTWSTTDAILTTEKRHELVEQRARTIRAFVTGDDWPKLRAGQLVRHLNRFKDIVAPFINPTVSRAQATSELSTLCEAALRVSGMINMSSLSFQFIFNECGIKFSEQSHHPLNSQVSPSELQSRHWRLMCVITPGITYRNDADGRVDPHFIAKANVLIMQ